MRKVCFDTELTDQQAQTKLETVFNNEIEFEDVMFIKYSKSFELRTKQWDDPLMHFNRKKLFDFFNIEIRLNQKTKGTLIELKLKTFMVSLSISSLILIALWSVDLYLLSKGNQFVFNVYTAIASVISIFVIYQIYKSNKRQQIVVEKLEKVFSHN